MTKARRELAALMPSQDVIVEVLDARMPVASANPIITGLRADTPCVKILTRADLADPAVTAAWLRTIERPGPVPVLAFAATTTLPHDTRRRFAAALAHLGLASVVGKPIKALIAGVPNVGKSTLINTLLDRQATKTSDKPAVTKVQQTLQLPGGTLLTDSPGLLWPRIVDETLAFRLAVGGAIPDTALDYQLIGTFAAAFLRQRYPDLLLARYKLPALPATGDAVLVEIGRRRGGLQPGGVVDLHKAASILVHDFRSGALGRISLEEPAPVDAGP